MQLLLPRTKFGDTTTPQPTTTSTFSPTPSLSKPILLHPTTNSDLTTKRTNNILTDMEPIYRTTTTTTEPSMTRLFAEARTLLKAENQKAEEAEKATQCREAHLMALEDQRQRLTREVNEEMEQQVVLHDVLSRAETLDKQLSSRFQAIKSATDLASTLSTRTGEMCAMVGEHTNLIKSHLKNQDDEFQKVRDDITSLVSWFENNFAVNMADAQAQIDAHERTVMSMRAEASAIKLDPSVEKNADVARDDAIRRLEHARQLAETRKKMLIAAEEKSAHEANEQHHELVQLRELVTEQCVKTTKLEEMANEEESMILHMRTTHQALQARLFMAIQAKADKEAQMLLDHTERDNLNREVADTTKQVEAHMQRVKDACTQRLQQEMERLQHERTNAKALVDAKMEQVDKIRAQITNAKMELESRRCAKVAQQQQQQQIMPSSSSSSSSSAASSTMESRRQHRRVHQRVLVFNDESEASTGKSPIRVISSKKATSSTPQSGILVGELFRRNNKQGHKPHHHRVQTTNDTSSVKVYKSKKLSKLPQTAGRDHFVLASSSTVSTTKTYSSRNGKTQPTISAVKSAATAAGGGKLSGLLQHGRLSSSSSSAMGVIKRRHDSNPQSEFDFGEGAAVDGENKTEKQKNLKKPRVHVMTNHSSKLGRGQDAEFDLFDSM